MRVLRNLLILLVLIVIAGFFVPANIRNGYAFFWYGQFTEAVSNDLGKAAAAYKSAHTAWPENARFAREYAATLNDIGTGFTSGSGNAEQYFQQALEFANEWVGAHEGDAQIWQLLVEKARAEWGLGRRNAARVSIDNAVDLMPTDYVALVYQGIIWRDINPRDRTQISRAIAVFEQAIQIRREQRTAWAHYEMAVAYKMLNDEVRALNECQQALAQWPDRDLRAKIERLKHELESGGRTNR